MTTVTTVKQKVGKAGERTKSKTKAAIEFAHQAERLGQYAPSQEDNATGSTQAVEAKFITALDPVIQTADGGRLPAVPVEEAKKLAQSLKEKGTLKVDINVSDALINRMFGASDH